MLTLRRNTDNVSPKKAPGRTRSLTMALLKLRNSDRSEREDSPVRPATKKGGLFRTSVSSADLPFAATSAAAAPTSPTTNNNKAKTARGLFRTNIYAEQAVALAASSASPPTSPTKNNKKTTRRNKSLGTGEALVIPVKPARRNSLGSGDVILAAAPNSPTKSGTRNRPKRRSSLSANAQLNKAATASTQTPPSTRDRNRRRRKSLGNGSGLLSSSLTSSLSSSTNSNGSSSSSHHPTQVNGMPRCRSFDTATKLKLAMDNPSSTRERVTSSYNNSRDVIALAKRSTAASKRQMKGGSSPSIIGLKPSKQYEGTGVFRR